MKKITYNLIYEFERGLDPKRALGIGINAKLLNDLNKKGISDDLVEIIDGLIYIKPETRVYDMESTIFNIQYKYSNTDEQDLLKKININDYEFKQSYNVNDVINQAYDAGISLERIENIIKLYGNNTVKKISKIFITKLKRSKDKIQHDNENNIYVFIGYTDKIPVTINGKQYFEERFEAENIIKIDKYNIADLSSVTAMKMRAQHQYGGTDGESGVYSITVPKFLMDEKNYNKIPDQYRNIIEKYKVKI